MSHICLWSPLPLHYIYFAYILPVPNAVGYGHLLYPWGWRWRERWVGSSTQRVGVEQNAWEKVGFEGCFVFTCELAHRSLWFFLGKLIGELSLQHYNVSYCNSAVIIFVFCFVFPAFVIRSQEPLGEANKKSYVVTIWWSKRCVFAILIISD